MFEWHFNQKNFNNIFSSLQFKLVDTMKIRFLHKIYMLIYRPRRTRIRIELDIQQEQFLLLIDKIHQFKIRHLIIEVGPQGNKILPHKLLQNIKVPIIKFYDAVNVPFCYIDYIIVCVSNHATILHTEFMHSLLELCSKGYVKKISLENTRKHRDLFDPTDYDNLEVIPGGKHLRITPKFD